MSVSTFMIVFLGFIVTDKIIEPRLGKYDKNEGDAAQEGINIEKLNPAEKRGLRAALITVLALGVLLSLTVLPENGVLRNPETGKIANSPFMHGIVAFIFLFFLGSGHCLRARGRHNENHR